MAVNERKEKLYPIVAIGFGLALFLMAVVVSPLGCSFLPASNLNRLVLVRDDANTILFSVRGNYRCLVSIEGPFPEWNVGVGIRFKDRPSFLNFEKSAFKYPDDFLTEGDILESGIIKLDRVKKQAVVDFKFKSPYYYNKPVNGDYDLSRVMHQIID